jgi:hypothetical protein
VLCHRTIPQTLAHRLHAMRALLLRALSLFQAMEEYDEFSGLSRRRYVAPNFAEARAHKKRT